MCVCVCVSVHLHIGVKVLGEDRRPFHALICAHVHTQTTVTHSPARMVVHAPPFLLATTAPAHVAMRETSAREVGAWC